ncbi:transglutaminase domain-containing protein [Luedemannella helvata]|uniref:Transglutaminase-like domain-containing protein n=1 Tax=Luedemannella helvata TaxID=349315 RepID=A0ABP4WHU8_9ACTN
MSGLVRGALVAPLVRVGFAGLLGALAGLGFAPAFGGFSGPLLTGVLAATGTAAGMGVVAALSGTSRSAPRLPAAMAGLVGALAVVAVAAAVTGAGAAVVHGPRQLLTGAVPADPTGPPLAAAAIVAGWSTLAALLLAVYARTPLAAAAPPVACLVIALSLGAAGPSLPAWYAAAFLAGALGLLLTGASRSVPGGAVPGGAARESAPGRRFSPVRAGLAAAIAVLAAVAAIVLGPGAPGVGTRPPADLRAAVAPPVTPRSGVSPLQQYLALRDGRVRLALTGTVSSPTTTLRMATLTRFDGSYWTVAGDFRRAGHQLPVAEAADARVVRAHVEVTAGELDWLVTAGRATTVSQSGLGVDEATGDLAVPIDTTPPRAYDVAARVGEPDPHRVLAAQPVPPAQPLTPPLPADVRSFVDRVVADQPEGADQLLALYRHFRDNGKFRYDQAEDAAGGHGYYQIQRLLATKRGTSEQYASAYAVLARQLGADARVVMGLRPRYTGERFEASGADVDAWVEVRFAGLGWVTLDPSPRANPIGTRAGARPAGSAPRPADDPFGQADRPDPVVDPDDEAPADLAGPSAADRQVPTWAWAATVLIALLLASVLATPAVKVARRTRRRRAGPTRLAVLGAWWETLERLREAGIAVTPSMTTGEVVARATGVAGLPHLASLVDSAAYAPEEPGPAQRTDAWERAGEVRRQLRATVRVTRRLAGYLDPRTLR